MQTRLITSFTKVFPSVKRRDLSPIPSQEVESVKCLENVSISSPLPLSFLTFCSSFIVIVTSPPLTFTLDHFGPLMFADKVSLPLTVPLPTEYLLSSIQPFPVTLPPSITKSFVTETDCKTPSTFGSTTSVLSIVNP